MNDIDPAQKPADRPDLEEYRMRREAANAANAEIEARRVARSAEILGDLGVDDYTAIVDRLREVDALRRQMEKDPTGRTSEEEAILDRNRHNIGARNVAHASIDYDGSLGGGSPSNPIRVPGVVHQ